MGFLNDDNKNYEDDFADDKEIFVFQIGAHLILPYSGFFKTGFPPPLYNDRYLRLY